MDGDDDLRCMMEGLTREESRKKILDQCDKYIADVGWNVIGVFGDDVFRQTPPFSYTVGLTHSFKHPELVVFGLPWRIAHAVLNDIGMNIKKGKWSFAAGDVSDRIFQKFPARFLHVPMNVADETLTAAFLYAQTHREPLPDVLQLVWPDPNGRFYDEPGYEPHCARAQPILANYVS